MSGTAIPVTSSWEDVGATMPSSGSSDGPNIPNSSPNSATRNSNDMSQDRPRSSSESAPPESGKRTSNDESPSEPLPPGSGKRVSNDRKQVQLPPSQPENRGSNDWKNQDGPPPPFPAPAPPPPPNYDSTQPETKYGAQGALKGTNKKICCCRPKTAVITMASVDLVLALLDFSILVYKCIESSEHESMLQYYMGAAVINGIFIIANLLLFCGVCSRSKSLCWTSVVLSWMGIVTVAILAFYLAFPHFEGIERILRVVVMIIEIFLMIFKTYAVHIFLKEIPPPDEEIQNTQVDEQTFRAPLPQQVPQQYARSYPAVNYGIAPTPAYVPPFVPFGGFAGYNPMYISTGTGMGYPYYGGYGYSPYYGGGFGRGYYF